MALVKNNLVVISQKILLALFNTHKLALLGLLWCVSPAEQKLALSLQRGYSLECVSLN